MALHWWHPGAVIAQDDASPQLHPGVWFAHALWAWSRVSSYFGQIDGSFSYTPFMALSWVFTTIAGPGLGQVLLYFFILASTWVGAFAFARRCGFSLAASTAAAWLYALNPLTQMVFGFVSSTQAWFIALIAWVGYFVVDAARSPQRRARDRAALGVLAFLALPVLGVTPTLVFQFAVGSVVIALFCSCFAPDVRAFWRWATVTAVALGVVCLWWAVPDVLSFAGAVIPHPTSLAGNAWTYARSSLLNNERFLWEWDWAFPEYFPSAAAYDGNVLVYSAGFVPFAAGLLGLAVLRGRILAIARIAVAWALFFMLVSKGMHPPLVWLSALLWKIPGFFLFDDSLGAAALALLLLCITSAAVFDTLLGRRRARIAGVGAAVVAAALSAVLLVSGAIHHGPVKPPDRFNVPSMYVRVPAYWTAAEAYLNGDPRRGGVLTLPPTMSVGYDVFYHWGYYGIDALSRDDIRRPVLQLDRGLTAGLGYVKHRRSQAQADAIHALLDTRSTSVVAALRRIGVRFVLYRSDLYDQQHVWLTDAQVGQMLGRQPLHFGALSLYNLGAPAPHVFFASTWGTSVTTASLAQARRLVLTRTLRDLTASGFALDVPASEHPSVLLDASKPVRVVAMRLAFGARRFACPLYVPLEAQTALDDSVIPCLRAGGIEPTPLLLARTRIVRITFDSSTTAQPGTLSLALLSLRAVVSHVAGIAADGTRARSACDARGALCTTGLMLLSVERPGLMVLNELEDRSWIGLEVGGGVHLARHVLVDGWANGWLLNGRGRLLLVNAVVACQILGLILAFGVVTWLVLRASRP